MSIPFDDSQRAFCESNAENIRLLAPAGSGKTLSLLERCRWLSEHKKSAEKPKFLIVTFTRAARDELKTRLIKDFASIQSFVEINTLNKWGLDYIRHTKSSLKTISDKDQTFYMYKDLEPVWSKYPFIKNNAETRLAHRIMRIIDELKGLGFQHNVPNLLESFYRQVSWINEVGLKFYYEKTIVSEISNLQLLDIKANTERERPANFLKFWAEAIDFLWNTGKISFDDQKYWALLKLEESYGNAVVRDNERYHHIMVDEFQDINPLDLALIKTLVRIHCSTLTIVGDDDQAIFEWRGSTPNFILHPEKHFGTKFQTYKLASNYRSPANIVRFSQNLISHNKKRESKSVVAKNILGDALVDAPVFPSHNDSLESVIELARSAYQSGQPKKLAIVGRKKSQLLPIQILLTSENIPYYAKEDLDVLNSDAFRDLKNIMVAIAQKTNTRSQIEIINDLRCCCDYVSTFKLNKAKQEHLENFLLIKHSYTLMDALKHFKTYQSLDGENKYLTPVMDIFESKTVFEAIESIGELRGMEKHYGKSDDDIFFKDPPFAYLAEFSKRYGDRFWDFIHQVENFAGINRLANADDGLIDEDFIKQPVHVMTATRTKGKEFDTVVLLDVNDGVWPNQLALTSDELEQERRVFYVAVTRPKQKLVLLTVQSIAGKSVKPSSYIAEMGLSDSRQSVASKEKNTKLSSAIPNHSPKLPRPPQQAASTTNRILEKPDVKPEYSSVQTPLNSNAKLSEDDIKKIFSDVFQQSHLDTDGWVDWEKFRNTLLDLYPNFALKNSLKLKFKAVIRTYSSFLEARYDQRHTNIAYIRIKRPKHAALELPGFDESVMYKQLPRAITRDLSNVFEKSETTAAGWVDLHEFCQKIYKLYPDFDTLISINEFKNLGHLLRADPDFVELSQDKKYIRLKMK